MGSFRATLWEVLSDRPVSSGRQKGSLFPVWATEREVVGDRKGAFRPPVSLFFTKAAFLSSFLCDSVVTNLSSVL